MRKLAATTSAWTGLLLAVFCSSPALAQKDFAATYQGGGSSCGKTYQLQGKEPFSGKHPVLIYLVGTEESYDTLVAQKVVSKAVDLGFVAATVQYDDYMWDECDGLHSRSRCIFDKSTPKSAIEVLCQRDRADCSKGVAVAGYSMGSVLAMMSGDFDPRVRAVYGMDAGVKYDNGTSPGDMHACVGPANRALPSNRLRAVNGEMDWDFGDTAADQRKSFQQLTQMDCKEGDYSCLRANGSGWVIVPNQEKATGADRCYMFTYGCLNGGTILDAKWSEGTYPWSLGPNLRWLKSLTDD